MPKATFEEIQKHVRETSFYLLGVLIEGRKDGTWKQHLFIWPFVAVVVVIVYLIVRSFI